MADKTKPKFYNRLFFNVYKNYALLLVMFSVLLGFIYLNLYQSAAINGYKDQVIRQAQIVSDKMNEFIREVDYSLEALEHLIIYRELIDGGVSTISKPDAKNPLPYDYETLSINDIEPAEADEMLKVINNAFEGKEPITETYYSELYGCTVISGAAPITGINGEICGAVLVSIKLDTQDKINEQGFSLIFISSMAAVFISIIIAALFVRNLTKPILKMRSTAIKLSEGRYETKTGISRNDELGDLAKTIDFLTDKLQENEQVRSNLEQMRFDFFANVSHELRTPITVVRAYTESLVDGVVTDSDKIGQYYDRMLTECKSMERLVGDLLLLSKMQNPDFVIETEPVNLVQIFEEIVRSIKVISEDRMIYISIIKGKDVYMMYGDYDRLRQMFLVIIDNALKFSHENSTIYITLKQQDKIYVSIRDEGIGISEEEQAFIFEKFYRSKLKQNEKGSGLGLSIAKQIAIKHNGRIEVKSELGKGTEFIFSFDYIKDQSIYIME